ncbi:MAG: glycosyltransferase [Solirubrobacterales bacterium]
MPPNVHRARTRPKIAYIVSRFPVGTETFIVRELNGVASYGDVDIELFSLFPNPGETIHPDAAQWIARLRKGSAVGALRATPQWLLRRPGAVLGAFLRVGWAYRLRPTLLWRAIATLFIAADHALTIESQGVRRIHAHFATYPALAAWMCHHLTGVPYSFTAHAHDLFLDQSFLPTLVRDADFAVPISEFNRRFIRAHASEPTPLHVVHCGVDPDRYEFRPRVPPAAGPVRALCIARLCESKGHRVLFEALAGSDELARLELDLVGPGELRGDLTRLAEELGLGNRVRFHGSLSEPEVLAFLYEADLLLLPSIIERTGFMEGIPVALMEAMAVGLPVVTSRLSGVPELVRDSETGLLAEQGDPLSLRRAIGAALTDPDATRRRVEAGRLLVEKEFDVRISARRMADLLSTEPCEPARSLPAP